MTEQSLPRKGLTTYIAGIPMEIYRFDEIENFAINRTQAIEAVDGTETGLKEYLDSTIAQSFLETNWHLPIEHSLDKLTLEVVTGYWMIQALQGNKKAQGLIFALAYDSLSVFAGEVSDALFIEGRHVDTRWEIADIMRSTWLSKDVPRTNN